MLNADRVDVIFEIFPDILPEKMGDIVLVVVESGGNGFQRDRVVVVLFDICQDLNDDVGIAVVPDIDERIAVDEQPENNVDESFQNILIVVCAHFQQQFKHFADLAVVFPVSQKGIELFFFEKVIEVGEDLIRNEQNEHVGVFGRAEFMCKVAGDKDDLVLVELIFAAVDDRFHHAASHIDQLDIAVKMPFIGVIFIFTDQDIR